MTSPRSLQISRFQSDLLDLSRWVAALLVVIEHLRSLMFADYVSASRMGLAGKVLYFMTGFGHEAVMVFFVMSGFLVGGRVFERLASGAFSWRKYVVDRGSRLYAVFLLALLLGAILDYLGYHYFNHFGLYDRSFSSPIAVVNHDFHQNLTAPIFALNMVMCQTVLGPVFGSNGPLWSLANEFWYYLAGPALFGLFFAPGRWRLVAGIGVLVLVGWLLPADMLLYSLVWILGAGLYFFNARPRLPLWLSAILLLGSLAATRLQWLSLPHLGNFLIAVSFALVINSAAGGVWRIPGHALSRRAADFSYSVYLCHFPFLVFVLSAFHQVTGLGLRMSPTARLFGLSLLILALVYLWCYLVSLVTERQTPRIRERFYGLLGLEPRLNPGTTH
jgi:peptidoglycan/LPS O-acetylase OafA/YrhL